MSGRCRWPGGRNLKRSLVIRSRSLCSLPQPLPDDVVGVADFDGAGTRRSLDGVVLVDEHPVDDDKHQHRQQGRARGAEPDDELAAVVPRGGSPEGGGSSGALPNDGSARGVGGITGVVGCPLGTVDPRSMTAVGPGSGSARRLGRRSGSGVGSGSGVRLGRRCAPTCSPAGRVGTTAVGCSLAGGSAGAVGSAGPGVAGDRCSVHADPSQYRWPPEPSGSGYQPAGVGGVVTAGE